MAGLDGLADLFQPWRFCGSVIQYVLGLSAQWCHWVLAVSAIAQHFQPDYKMLLFSSSCI